MCGAYSILPVNFRLKAEATSWRDLKAEAASLAGTEAEGTGLAGHFALKPEA